MKLTKKQLTLIVVFLEKIDVTIMYQYKTSVGITDLNIGNHLAHNKLTEILHEARADFLDSYGFSEKDIEGVGLILSNITINFKKEGFYKDSLTISLKVGETSGARSMIDYDVVNQNNETIATASTGVAFFDYNKRKPARTPSFFRNFNN